MAYKLILPIITLIITIVILAVYFINPGNSLIRYFVPRFLPDKEHSKKTLRQAGTGCIFFSAWLTAIIVSVYSSIDFKILENILWLMALLCFILPIVLIMFLCIGLYYLAIGIFAKSDNIKPKFQSIFAANKSDLEIYIKKLKFYTILNLSFLFMTVLSVTMNIIFEKYVGEKLIPLNILFLIGFILTLWRVRAYITKTAIAMDLSGKKYLLTTLFYPTSIFFVWINSVKLLKMFKNTNKSAL